MAYFFILFCTLISACPCNVAANPQQQRYDEAIAKLNQAATEEQRFYALDKAAKESFSVGKIEDARNFANELMKLAEKYADNWNYGNAIQDANIVLGRIALKKGNINEAKTRLLAAGASPGSPVMDSFGPNMSLASDLLQKGERDTVIKYLELCRKFWRSDDGRWKIDQWEKDVRSGDLPDFGPNLIY